MKVGDAVLYTIPAGRTLAGQAVRVNIVDSSRDGSLMIRLELVRNVPEFIWVGKSELKPIPPAASEATRQAEFAF